MSGRLQKLRVVNPVLTNVAVGFKNDKYIGDQALPVVANIPKEEFEIITFGKEAFALEDDVRAPRARRKRVDFAYEATPAKLEERSLEAALDDRELDEGVEWVDLARRRTLMLQDKAATRREYQQANLVFAAASYASGHSATLSGADQWSHADSHPETVIEAAMDVVAQKIGRRPNTLVLGAQTWKALKTHAEIRAILGLAERKIVTMEHVRELFDLDRVLIGRATMLSGNSLQYIWGKHAALLWTPESPAVDEPSFGYTFQKKGRPRVTTYREEGTNSDVIAVENIYKAAVTCGLAGYLLRAATA